MSLAGLAAITGPRSVVIPLQGFTDWVTMKADVCQSALSKHCSLLQPDVHYPLSFLLALVVSLSFLPLFSGFPCPVLYNNHMRENSSFCLYLHAQMARRWQCICLEVSLITECVTYSLWISSLPLRPWCLARNTSLMSVEKKEENPNHLLLPVMPTTHRNRTL